MKRYFLRAGEDYAICLPVRDVEAAVAAMPGMRREDARHFVFENEEAWQFMDVYLDLTDGAGHPKEDPGAEVNRVRLEIVPRALYGDARDTVYSGIADRLADAILWRVWDPGSGSWISSSWFNRGYGLTAAKDYEGARRCYARCVEENRDAGDCWCNLGYVLRKFLARPQEAFDAVTQALRVDGKRWIYWFQIGLCHRALGRPLDALASYETSIKLGPHETMPYNNKCATLNFLGRHGEAMAAIDAALAFAPDDAFSNYNKACTHRFQGDREACLALLARVFRLDPALKEAAPKEPELEPLWNDPEFIALCAPGPAGKTS